MKKKLFAVVILVLVYVLFVFVFASIDKQNKVTQVLSKIGISSSSALASTTVVQDGTVSSDLNLKASFRSPIPAPLKKPAPRDKDKKDGGTE